MFNRQMVWGQGLSRLQNVLMLPLLSLSVDLLNRKNNASESFSYHVSARLRFFNHQITTIPAIESKSFQQDLW